MKSQGNISSTKYNNFSITELKRMKFYGLVDKEFKIAILNKLNEVQNKKEKKKTSERQFNKFMKKQIQNEILSKEIEYIKKASRNTGAEEFNE